MQKDPNISNEKYCPTKEEFLLLFEERLTKRQKEVVLLKCQGKSDEEIALAYGIKINTVSKHINNACAELLISDPNKVRNNENRETLIRLCMMYLFNDN